MPGLELVEVAVFAADAALDDGLTILALVDGNGLGIAQIVRRRDVHASEIRIHTERGGVEAGSLVDVQWKLEAGRVVFQVQSV